MSQHLGRHIKQLLMAQGFKPGSFEGCSKKELNREMQAQKVTFLPRKYIEFMEIMGKKGLPFVSRTYYCNGLIDF